MKPVKLNAWLLLIGLVLVGCTSKSPLPEGNTTTEHSSLPDCYITTEDKCAKDYDLVQFSSYWSMLNYKQCCREPHYVLQTIEPTLYELKGFCDGVANTIYINESEPSCEIETKFATHDYGRFGGNQSVLCSRCKDTNLSIMPNIIPAGDWICPV